MAGRPTAHCWLLPSLSPAHLTLLSTPRIPAKNQAPLFDGTSPCRYETGLELFTEKTCAKELAVLTGMNFRPPLPSRPPSSALAQLLFSV